VKDKEIEQVSRNMHKLGEGNRRVMARRGRKVFLKEDAKV
jgi:hypothetical protein